ncbi:MAG TPA: bifunctional 4-hydroxy-2-oxoglutarate aldolase/2-dehydro-3-deoxy-phosphogluconate aldolase, partial [Flavisolibacter sp.]
AVNAGARFIISPIVNKDVIDAAKQRGVVSIPGAFTATEIHQAVVYGADIIKIFPASVGPQYIRDLRGPFPHIPLMPTGGVDLDNIAAFSRAGAAAFGVGSALVKANKDLDNDYITSLTAKAKQFVTAISIEGEPGK